MNNSYLRGYLQGYMSKEAAEGADPEIIRSTPESGRYGKAPVATKSTIVNQAKHMWPQEKARIGKGRPERALARSNMIKDVQPTTDMAKKNPELYQAQKDLLAQGYEGMDFGKDTDFPGFAEAALSGETRPKQLQNILNLYNARNTPEKVRRNQPYQKQLMDLINEYELYRTKGGLSPDEAFKAVPERREIRQQDPDYRGPSKDELRRMIERGIITAQNTPQAPGNTAVS